MRARTWPGLSASHGPAGWRRRRNASNSVTATIRRCTVDHRSVPVSRPVLQCHCRPRRSHGVPIRSNRTAYRPIGSWSRNGIRGSSTGFHWSSRHQGPVSSAVASRRIMRVSSARMLRIVAGAGSRPVRRCTACWICWHQSLPGIASSETGALPGLAGDDLAQPAHQHAQARRRDRAAQADDLEDAPGHLAAHRVGQVRQVHPGPPGPVMAERARVLRRDGVRRETRQPHLLRHRRPQGLQRLRVGPPAGGLNQFQRGLAAGAGHEHAPAARRRGRSAATRR